MGGRAEERPRAMFRASWFGNRWMPRHRIWPGFYDQNPDTKNPLPFSTERPACRFPSSGTLHSTKPPRIWACYHYAAALCGACFSVARRRERSVAQPHKRANWRENRVPQSGFRRSRRHSSLLVAHLEPPNFTPHALIDAVPDGTEHRCIVVTGPYPYFSASSGCGGYAKKPRLCHCCRNDSNDSWRGQAIRRSGSS